MRVRTRENNIKPKGESKIQEKKIMGKDDHAHGGSKLERRLSRDHGTHAPKSDHGAHKQSAHHPHGRRMSVIGKDGRKSDVSRGFFDMAAVFPMCIP